MRIWLVRHGLTLQGEQKRYQGSLDTPLSENGKAQLAPADHCPGTVCVTPLRRTQETAAIVFPDAEQIVVQDLREMDFGAFEGRNWKEMEDDAAYREWVEGNCEGRCPGGEDRASFSARVCGAFAELVQTALEQNEEELVIVAHGGTQMAVLERWGGTGKAYYEWQTACGHGWLLDTAGWPERLHVTGEVDYTV